MLVRVGTLNNFNFTKKEFEQLFLTKEIERVKNNYYNFFIWSNVLGYNSQLKTNTKRMLKDLEKTFLNVNMRVGLTVNPTLENFIKPLNTMFVNCLVVKATTNNKPVLEQVVRYAKQRQLPVLVVFQRFRKRETFEKFISKRNRYKYNLQSLYFRLGIPYRKQLLNELREIYKDVRACDLEDTGCQGCRNCEAVNYYLETGDMYSLNLSTSGFCPYQNSPKACPDCYASYCISRTKGKIAFDRIIKNTKMKKKTKKVLHYGQLKEVEV